MPHRNLIFPGVYRLKSSIVNLYLIEDDASLTLIDTGYAGDDPLILEAARSLHKPIRHIIITHAHSDHAGGLAALRRQIDAPVYAHPLDAPAIRGDAPMPAFSATPTLIYRLMFRMFSGSFPQTVEAAPVDHVIEDDDLLPFGGGLRVIHTPGHSPGHISLLLERDGGLLFAADACTNLFGLGHSVVQNDFEQAKASLRKLAALSPAVICFGHGSPLTRNAAARFRRRWA